METTPMFMDGRFDISKMSLLPQMQSNPQSVSNILHRIRKDKETQGNTKTLCSKNHLEQTRKANILIPDFKIILLSDSNQNNMVLAHSYILATKYTSQKYDTPTATCLLDRGTEEATASSVNDSGEVRCKKNDTWLLLFPHPIDIKSNSKWGKTTMEGLKL